MKDHQTFVSAAAQVAAAHPEARFLIVGRGVSTREAGVLAAIDSVGLHDRAIVLEERHDIGDVFNAVDIACSSSAWGEGFSNAIGEAMACGVPCVVTDIGDSAAIVADTGMVVAPRDPSALAAAIVALVASGPERRRALGEGARRRVEERFSLATVVAQYEALYETLAQGGATPHQGPAQIMARDR
jgi:glycosyltransferase involved in cell wall biosynthesis